MNVKQSKYFRSIKFSSLTESEYYGLEEQGMLYEYYPQATGNYMKDMKNAQLELPLEYTASVNHQEVDLSPQAEHDGLWPYNAGADYIDKVYDLPKDGLYTDDYDPNQRDNEPCRGHDMVSNPSHYELGNTGVEAIDVIEAALTREEYIGYLRGNILKYQLRSNKKNGSEDLRKADIYSGWLVEVLEE